MTAPARFRQSDIRRALKAAEVDGFEEARVVIHPDGKIEVIARRTPGSTEAPLEFD